MSLKKITRKICCIISANNDPVLRDIICELNTDGVNNVLKKENLLLQEKMKAELPKITVKNCTVYNEEEIRSAIKADEVRFVIHDCHKSPDGEFFCKTNSHVGEFTTALSKECGETSFDYRFHADAESFAYLVADVMLDIQMFYYYSLDTKFTTLNDKRKFSALKVNFCKQLKNRTSYNEATSLNNYCSFAFFCRQEDNTLNYDKYIKMWRSFTESLNNDVGCPDVCGVADYIISNHPFGKQLSHRKLVHLLKSCNKGETYVLIHIYKRPKTKYSKQKIRALFGKKKIRVGMIKIIPLRLKYQYLKHRVFVDAFEFVA